ncbi:gliding motility lipoprotein GldH [Foetidibacter luteolus]|uniref:gliding motility lipoprotein GldH n=1 Tax=Foetidibacter luteolus TaxID=2608880 RepID=UPI001A996E37|nr:gliding motility lipoprotein GldH [Foetidibacter luteolus]
MKKHPGFHFRKSFVYILVAIVTVVASCRPIDVYEKTYYFKMQDWDAAIKPEFQFKIEDSMARYNLFVVLRHTDAYSYNNIWLNLTIIPPGDTAQTQLKEFILANNSKGWLGSGMDDVFEHRIKVNAAPIKFKTGNYRFTLQQAMRQNPLHDVLNAGIRLEKAE